MQDLTKKFREGYFEFCKDNDAVKIIMPEAGSKLKFHAGRSEFKAPLVISYDFECALQKVEVEEKNEAGESYTKVTENRSNCN